MAEQIEIDIALRDIFMQHFHIDNKPDPESMKAEDNPGYRAYAGYAVEVGVALANLILATKRPESSRGFRAISDLVFALNANEFWIKNAPVLVPVLTIVLNSHRDYVDMFTQRLQMSDYAKFDKMMSAADGVSLELFSMLLYLVGGPQLMTTESLALKKDLAPYFLD